MTFDTHTPALLLMIGDHAWDYGALATARTLGRVGVPVYAALADRTNPVVASKYLTQAFPWLTTGAEADADLVAGIRRMCERIGRPAVAIAGDDESAVLLARRRADLAEVLLLPTVAPQLPDQLADKGALASLCRETETPTPASISPESLADIQEFAASARFPLVVKNPEPFSRLVNRAVPTTAKVDDVGELLALLSEWQPGTPLLVQEFLPQQTSQDWYVAAVLSDDHEPAVAFSGIKRRAFPDATGVGTLSESRYNAELVDQAMQFCGKIGYAGVCDMDWRLDERDGLFKLLDFNPRRGAQFSTFRSTADMDVVRALHLVMTGRPVPPGQEVDGIRHVVGVLDQRAYIQRRSLPGEPGPLQGCSAERAWWATDDPAPGIRFAAQLGPWGRLARKMRPQAIPASNEWRKTVHGQPAPVPFDKPGPPRPVERWRATMIVGGESAPVLVAVAVGDEAAQRVRHECAARSWARRNGVSVPVVLAEGRDWMVSQLVDVTDSVGADYVDEALRSAALIRAAAEPPPAAVSSWQGSRRDRAQRLVRALIGHLPLKEFFRVREEAAKLQADVWVHGDYSSSNVMNSDTGIRVIDWEFAGLGIWGTDEIRLWSTMEHLPDRERLMTRFIDTLPAERHRDTGVLMHWLALRQLAENLAAPRRYQNPENIALGHVTLTEARAWRTRLSH